MGCHTSRWQHILLVAWLVWGVSSGLCGSLARAAPSQGQAERGQASERSVVHLRCLGPQHYATTLHSLIESELTSNHVSVRLADPTQAMPRWLRETRAERHTLLIAVLETRHRDYWEVTIVDAARRRAIKRQLPGGVAHNAAALEAVASIIVSAVAALQDGLEVASEPIETVIPETAEVPSPSSTPASTTGPAPGAEPAEPPNSVVPRAALLVSLASFSPERHTTLGAGLAAGLEFPSLALRVLGVRFQPATFRSEFGEFKATRSQLGLLVSHPLGGTSFQLEPEARVLMELHQRSGGEAAVGVSASPDTTLIRYAGLGGVRGLVWPWPHLGLGLFAGGGYAPRRIRFVTSPNSLEIASLWPWIVCVEAGLELRLP